MNRSLRATVALAALSLAAALPAATIRHDPPAIGAVAPDFKLVDQNGKAETLSAARGKKVVLVFYRGYW